MRSLKILTRLSVILLFVRAGMAGNVSVVDSQGNKTPLSGPNYAVTATLGKRPSNGQNLFHSFHNFDLSSGDVATFEVPTGVNNVFARVSGGASTIDGTLACPANFFLINRDGVIFGPNAKLNVSGSFAVTTADFIELADGVKFGTGQDDTLLTTAAPAAFGFLGPDGSRTAPAKLTINGSRLVLASPSPAQAAAGNVLTVVGGPVEITNADVTAAADRVNLVASGLGQRILLDPLAPKTPFDPAQLAARESITLTQTKIDTGSNIEGGDMVIAGSTVTLSGAKLFNRGVLGRAGTVRIDAANVLINDHTSMSGLETSPGAAGDIDINATGSLDIEDSRLAVDTVPVLFLFGGAGDITLNAKSIRVHNSQVVSLAAAGFFGGGDITITANQLLMENGSTIDARTGSIGQAGNITLEIAGMLSLASNSTIDDSTGSAASAGQLTIHCGRLSMSGESSINSKAIFGIGQGGGGNVSVRVDHDATLTNSTISTETNTLFRGGDIEITAETLTLTQSARISSESKLGPAPGDAPQDHDGAGDIAVTTTGDLTISDDSSISAATHTNGPSGTITINVGGNLGLAGESVISSQSTAGDSPSPAYGDAGAIQIVADTINLSGNSSVTVQAEPTNSVANGGALSVFARQSITLEESSILARASGVGGNILIQRATVPGQPPPPLSLTLDNSTIAASATGDGKAGSVTVFAQSVLLDAGSTIDSSNTGSGDGGRVEIRFGDLSLDPTAKISANSRLASAGDIVLVTKGSFNLLTGGSITTNSGGAGGNISLHADGDVVFHGVSISATAGSPSAQTKAAEISIHAGAGRIIDIRKSDINTSAKGTGGNITIDPMYIILDNTRIVARGDVGNGGNITLTSSYYFRSPDTVIDASSHNGNDGRVSTPTPDLEIVDALITLPSGFESTDLKLRDLCGNHVGGSSFIVTGAGGVAPSPGGWSTSEHFEMISPAKPQQSQ